MAVAFRNASSAAAQAASVTVNKPTGVVTDDIMVLFTATTANAAFTTPTGWTVLTSSVIVQDGAATLMTVAAYYRFAGASEPTTFTVTNASSGGISAAISAWSGVSKTNPIDASARAATANNTTSIATPTVTTTKAGSGVVIAAVTAVNLASAPAVTYPTGTTKDSEALGTTALANNSGSGVGQENALIATAGTTTTSRTLTTASNAGWSAWTVALQQANATYNQAGAAAATFTAARGSQQISKLRAAAVTFAVVLARSLLANRSLAAPVTFATTATRAGTLRRSLTTAVTPTAVVSRSVSAARAFTASMTTGVARSVTVSAMRTAAMTPATAFTRSISAARSFAAPATLSTVFNRGTQVPRAYVASVAFTVKGRVDIAMSVLNRMTGGGGTTIIKKITTYVFDD
ncbi:hypothetical protein NBH00_05250 [Paraconexibacter antarcticus]|uniref:Uncharacterized protein n=1 Tax=Paraconexibacter antarcticus TaxID=2949664 RepID=A0ABY5DXR9_9ACTN|nr:hypothetical protein [Paraconexibacter antarcticus]UTI65617.1 hypothetical protein NBH00_05250 [Paraconexibacter antarcticus]